VSARFTDAPGFQRHDFPSRHDGRCAFCHLWQFLGNTEHLLTASHLGPDVIGADAGVNPKNNEIVDEIGTFPDYGIGVAVHGVDDDLDRFFGELFGHFGAARTQQPGRPRFRRVSAPNGDHSLMEPGDRISHAGTIPDPDLKPVNETPPEKHFPAVSLSSQAVRRYHPA
jgi:hypothetical protein